MWQDEWCMTRGLGKDTGRTGHYVRPETHEESSLPHFFYFLKTLSLRGKENVWEREMEDAKVIYWNECKTTDAIKSRVLNKTESAFTVSYTHPTFLQSGWCKHEGQPWQKAIKLWNQILNFNYHTAWSHELLGWGSCDESSAARYCHGTMLQLIKCCAIDLNNWGDMRLLSTIGQASSAPTLISSGSERFRRGAFPSQGLNQELS